MPKHRATAVASAALQAQAAQLTGTIYQLKVTLRGSKPLIWRRLLVSDQTTLGKLHDILQIAMGWTDSHLHLFSIGGVNYGVPSPDDWGPVEDERRVNLQRVVQTEKAKFRYEYDFGDSWEHEIVVEKIMASTPEMQIPSCIKGVRACPPEDVGGVWGYASFLEAIQDPEHPEHDTMVEWIGDDFDPEEFDMEEVNAALRTIR